MKMDISGLWSLQLMMFFMVTAGAVLKKTNILKDDSKGVLTDLVVYLFLPCSIINSFRMELKSDIFVGFITILSASLVIQFLCYFLSKAAYNKESEAVKRVMQYCTIVSNTGFLGLPIAEGLFGAEGVMYASIFIIPMRVMMWSAGIACFTESPDFKSVVKKIAVHPCIVAVYIGLALLIFQRPLLGIYENITAGDGIVSSAVIMLITALNKSLSATGGCTTAITMLIIGMMIADIDFGSMLDKNTIIITLFRLIILPVTAFAGCWLLNIDPFLSGIIVVMSGMPAGSTAPIMAAKYGCDYKFATKCVVVSTLFSMISIPGICMLLI